MKTEFDISDSLAKDLVALKKICRICLSANETYNMISLLSEKDKLFQKIMLCTGVKIEKDDKLPSLICGTCSKDLIQADRFRVKCETSDTILRKVINDTKRICLAKDNEVIDAKDIKEEQVGTEWQDQNLFIAHNNQVAVEGALSQPNLINCDVSETDCELEQLHCDHCEKVYCAKDEMSVHIKNEHSFEIFKSNRMMKTDFTYQGDKQYVKNESVDYSSENAIETLKTSQAVEKKKRGRKENLNFNGCVIGVGSDKKYKCLECEFVSKYKKSLIGHVRTHTGEKPYVCEICSRPFSQAASLISHRKIHSDKMYYTCPICGRQFKHKQKYERHKGVHSTEKTFICSICNKGLKSKVSLKIHLNRHYNVKNYNCETCGATFVASSELINHSKIHSNDRKFACHICKFKTYKKTGLDKHLKYHSGETPFKCDLCGSSYAAKEQLTNHMRKHTKEREYSCDICQQKFNYSTTLNRHMLRIHGIKFKWCNVVDRRVVK